MSRRRASWSRSGLAILAAGFILLFLIVALGRIGTPYELEWMEGAMVDHTMRLLSGQPLYAAPSLDFVPFPYPPVFHYAGAIVALIVGPSFTALRIVSLLATLGVLILIGLFVPHEGGHPAWGLVAAGIFAATFPLSGGWFDVGRVDTLMLALILAALYTARVTTTWRGDVLAGGLATLAIFTKQPALIALLPALILAPLWLGWRRAARFLGALCVTSAVLFMGLNALYGGWFKHYTLDLVSQHTIIPEMLTGFWTGDLLGQVPVLLLLALIALILPPVTDSRRGWLFYVALLGGLLGGSWSGRMNWGSVLNMLMPVHAGLAILAGLALAGLDRLARERGGRFSALLGGAALILAAQLIAFVYAPATYLPDAADLAAQETYAQTIAHLDGRVWTACHGHVDDQPPRAHGMAMIDFLMHDPGHVTGTYRATIDAAIEAQAFDAIVVDAEGLCWPDQVIPLDSAYAPLDDSPTLQPPVLSGFQLPPEVIYVPVGRDDDQR
jgi:4-amino-4-deoxy-L-arabinose transferase-like glycosyltransferase